MAAPITSIDSSTGGVKIQWIAPYNNADTITKYKIEILTDTDATTPNTYTETTTYCDGSLTTVISNLYCIVPMSALITTPFSLDYLELVTVRVSAYNSFGWSSVSLSNSAGATIRVVPVKMASPTRGDDSTISQIQVNWTPLTTTADMGGSAITSYHL